MARVDEPAEEPEDDFGVEADVEGGAGPLFGGWMAAMQAELMLGHLAAAGPSWPQANLYCHACVTALRSVTFMLQKALRHEEGFGEWYEAVQDRLRGDPEMVFLKEARNFVLKQGALELMMSFSVHYDGPLPMKIKAIGPDGPEVLVKAEGSSEWVPADWRRLEGFRFDIPLRLGHVEGLPEPPGRELRRMLAEKIAMLRVLLHEAEERFDPQHADPDVARRDRAELERLLAGSD